MRLPVTISFNYLFKTVPFLDLMLLKQLSASTNLLLSCKKLYLFVTWFFLLLSWQIFWYFLNIESMFDLADRFSGPSTTYFLSQCVSILFTICLSYYITHIFLLLQILLTQYWLKVRPRTVPTIFEWLSDVWSSPFRFSIETLQSIHHT